MSKWPVQPCAPWSALGGVCAINRCFPRLTGDASPRIDCLACRHFAGGGVVLPGAPRQRRHLVLVGVRVAPGGDVVATPGALTLHHRQPGRALLRKRLLAGAALIGGAVARLRGREAAEVYRREDQASMVHIPFPQASVLHVNQDAQRDANYDSNSGATKGAKYGNLCIS